MKHLSNPKNSRAASALMIVIWAVLMMGMTVAGFIEYASISQDSHIAEAKRFKARMLAESGIALGLHPDITPGDPLLVQEIDSNTRRLVRIQGESGRFALSFADVDTSTEILTELFQLWGVDPQAATVAAESIADWVDTDTEARSSGAEVDYYSAQGRFGLPNNTTFGSLEELLLVRGFDVIDRVHPDWRESLTLYGDGLIDLNSAPSDIIQAAAGVTESEAEQLISKRAGGDGVEGTPDDAPFASLEEASRALGLSGDSWTDVEARFVTTSAFQRIESTVVVGDFRHTVLVITQTPEGGGEPSYVSREEY